ncbi:MAG: hypothetical protein ACRDSP_08945 [Pseudonocardiaceae bacterium]
MTGRARPARGRALRYGAGTTAAVLLICTLIAGRSAWTLSTVGARVSGATARTHGEVIHSAGHGVELRWSAPGIRRTDHVELAVPVPPAGTRTEVAYDPREPATVLLPGSTELAAVDRAASGVAFSGLVAAMVLLTLGWQVTSRRLLRGRAAHAVPARRVRVQSGLLTRSWLELDSIQRWIPVHFDPVLVTLPAPASVQVHGDPRHHRLVAAEVDGVWLYPSGAVRASEPAGRRIDSPALPDADALPGTGWWRQLRADAALITPAPVVGLLWVFLDGGGIPTWACATALAAALALGWAALRGSDPT